MSHAGAIISRVGRLPEKIRVLEAAEVGMAESPEDGVMKMKDLIRNCPVSRI